MFVPFETAPVKPIEPGQNVTAELQAIINGDLPAFVMQSAGATIYDAVGPIKPALAEVGFEPQLSEYTMGSERTDLPLHADSQGYYEHDGFTQLSVHHTSEGTVQVSLFEVLKNPSKLQPASYTNLPTEFEDLFAEGKVDDEFLAPVCYTATIRTGDLIVFRISGKRFLAHAFKSISEVRKSVILLYNHYRQA